jgi:hypothetical protein
MTGFNLPPGVSESMIPGNRPEDEAYEKLHQVVYEVARVYGRTFVLTVVLDAVALAANDEMLETDDS